MTPEERDSLISVLVVLTGFSPQAFERKTDEELRKEYERRTEDAGGLV